jgi:hypothetical protein
MLISMKLEELEFVVEALGDCRGHPIGMPLVRRLAQQAKQQRRMQEPVKVALTLNGCEYAATLNPESDEVEVRIAGIPSMSGEWRKPWFREGIDEEPEHESIQRRDEYEGQPQPDDATLEVLSVALRHALRPTDASSRAEA